MAALCGGEVEIILFGIIMLINSENDWIMLHQMTHRSKMGIAIEKFIEKSLAIIQLSLKHC